jgi:hypothetical protein
MTGVVVNVVSHPLAFVVVVPVLRLVLSATAALVVVEVAVVYFEAWMLVRRDRVRSSTAIMLSAIANVLSLSLGFLLLDSPT